MKILNYWPITRCNCWVSPYIKGNYILKQSYYTYLWIPFSFSWYNYLWIPFCFSCQVSMCGLCFLVLFMGNFFTTVAVVLQKLKSRSQKLKRLWYTIINKAVSFFLKNLSSSQLTTHIFTAFNIICFPIMPSNNHQQAVIWNKMLIIIITGQIMVYNMPLFFV